ncbi:MAG: transcriptional regulator [Candidatus Nanohaloarchaea archaeon]|nr:transcriptional regulator [Candidatus Nanohaloarchaea archaeon]
MRLLCETVVRDILPAVRSLVAKELHDQGYSQTEIAELLDLTQPAVSQYLTAARGKEVQRIEKDPEAYSQVEDLVDVLVDGSEDQVTEEFCEACITIRENGIFEKGFEGSEEMDALCDFQNS